ncbi:MAG: flagellar filament capping protein FliD [Solirubrobacteraceae bacterium]|nr:flagellar filament capping protein FliD [Solirubrobacteraceae bacterium]
MAGIALSGLASGLDTSSMISAILSAESTGRTVLANQQTQAQARVTKLTAIQTKLATLQSQTNALASVGNWLPTQTVSSSDSTIATATRTGGAGAGSYSVNVLGLASSSQKTFSYTAPGADTSLTFGATTVNLSAGATIDDAVNAINQQGGDVVAVNAQGKLVVSSTTTGAASSFSFSGGAVSLDSERTGQDARYTIDGGAVQTSPTNAVTGAMPGIDLNLTRTGSVGITVGTPGPNADGLVSQMKAWVDAYNAAQDQIRTTTTEQPVKGATNNVDLAKGVLFGDTSLSTLANSLRSNVGTAVSGLTGSVKSFADLGISTGATNSSATINQDSVNGKLVFDEAKFRAALAKDPSAVRTVLGATNGTNGLSQQFNTVLTPATTAGQGISDRIEQQNANVKRLTTSLTTFDSRLSAREDALKKQFALMESALNRSQTLQSQLSSQLASLTGFSG